MFKVNYKNTRRRHWGFSGVFIVSFELISHFLLVFLLLELLSARIYLLGYPLLSHHDPLKYNHIHHIENIQKSCLIYIL